MTERVECIRCGECCLKSSPTLHQQDLSKIGQGAIRLTDLYTIRRGELISDPVHQELRITPHEWIKVKEDQDGGCRFYSRETKNCTIYEDRPLQCIVLKCWDTTDFLKACQVPRLERIDLIRDGILLELIRAHEERAGHETLEHLLREVSIKGEAALMKILEILKFDYALRPFVQAKNLVRPEEMDLVFGRPLTQSIQRFGLEVIEESTGNFLLRHSR